MFWGCSCELDRIMNKQLEEEAIITMAQNRLTEISSISQAIPSLVPHKDRHRALFTLRVLLLSTIRTKMKMSNPRKVYNF